MTRPRVLVIADYFLPGFRAGGPIRAIANSMARLSSEIAFSVVTRDHDTDGVRYREVRSGSWNDGAAGPIYYTPRLTQRVLERCIHESSADVLWLNSFFSRASVRVLLSRRLGRIGEPILLAPRGEFSAGALALKRRRKTLGRLGLLHLGFLNGIHWIASSAAEERDLHKAVGIDADLSQTRVIESGFSRTVSSSITIVPESVGEMASPDSWPAKTAGELRLVFASRLDPMKNLQFLLEVLQQSSGRIHLDVIGPIYIAAYWEACQRLIQRLPANVTVDYHGGLPHHELLRRLPRYDVLALPSRGENFGHIVPEAWAAGCPVLVSDRTPWRNLAEAGVGWDLPLERQAWVDALQRCVAMSPEDHHALRQRAVARSKAVWREGLRGDAVLKHLIATLVQRDAGRTALSPDGLAAVDPDPCR